MSPSTPRSGSRPRLTWLFSICGVTCRAKRGEPLSGGAAHRTCIDGADITGAGIACIVAAIIGGGLKAFGLEIPVFNSLARQGLLATFGAVLLGLALLVNSNNSSPGPKIIEKPVELIPAPSSPVSTADAARLEGPPKPEPTILDEPPAITEEREGRLPRKFLDFDERRKFSNFGSLAPDERSAFEAEVHNKSIAISGVVVAGGGMNYGLANVVLYGWNDNVHPKLPRLQFFGEKYRQMFLPEETITAICFIDDISLMSLFDCQLVNQ